MAEHIVRLEEMRNAYDIFVGTPQETVHLGDQDVRMILKWVLKK
jgi:hypothetical protein